MSCCVNKGLHVTFLVVFGEDVRQTRHDAEVRAQHVQRWCLMVGN